MTTYPALRHNPGRAAAFMQAWLSSDRRQLNICWDCFPPQVQPLAEQKSTGCMTDKSAWLSACNVS